MSLTIAGLFAGIGGIELGLHQAGHRSTLLCEVDPLAQRILLRQFPGVPVVGDVRELIVVPQPDVLAAGFPCQDLSQAGRTAGITGDNSSLVGEVFRLIRTAPPTWLLLENVPFMLQLDRGEAMRYLTSSLEELGFNWCYRVIDSRAFGLPQRRQRVILLAARDEDPRGVLLNSDAGPPEDSDSGAEVACGFYWTEGVRGLGWAVDAIPTLKGGSTIGIPSPPAIRFADGFIGLPALQDAERLQGFPDGWTDAASDGTKRRDGARWKLLGNAVNVPVARWVGRQLAAPGTYDGSTDERLEVTSRWPRAAWGMGGVRKRADVSAWPVREPYAHLAEFLEHEPKALSLRASEGFLARTRRSTLRFPPGLIESLEAHVRSMRGEVLAA